MKTEYQSVRFQDLSSGFLELRWHGESTIDGRHLAVVVERDGRLVTMPVNWILTTQEHRAIADFMDALKAERD